MKLLTTLALATALAAPAVASDSAFTLHLAQPDYAPFEDVTLGVEGQPGQFGFLLFDTDPTPTEVLPGLTVDLGLSYNFFVFPVTLPASGLLELPYSYDCTRLGLWTSLGGMLHAQAVSLDPTDASLCVSNAVTFDVTNQYGFCIECQPCEGAVTDLTLRYLGASPMYVEVTQKKGKDDPILFGATVQPFETFTFQGAGKHGKMNPEITVTLDGVLDTKIHTSCSVPIGPGQEWGSFRILEAVSHEGGPICPEDDGGTTPVTDCSAGKPIQLEFTYTGGDCSESDNDQDPSKATCSGDPDDAAMVRVVVHGKQGTYLDNVVSLGDSFWVDPAAIGESKIDSNLCVDLYDPAGNLLQALTLHTSCSQPLAVGDVYGGIELVTFVPKP